MAELTLEPRRTCASNFYFEATIPGSTGNWRVVYSALPQGEPYAYGWQCECPAFQFSKRNGHGLKSCKHTKAAEELRCGYGWEAFCGDRPTMRADGRCPQCGGPTSGMLVGV